MEFEKEASSSMPASPTAQYFNSSVLSLFILGIFEFEVPIDDSQVLSLLKDVFLPINPRFSSIMVEDKKGARKWKKVEVNLKDHVNVPVFPKGLSPDPYQDYFNDYFSKLAMDQLPQNRPLWEIHIIKYPTTNASGGHIIFKLHHALGDGYSLMGALLSSIQRADNPSLPLTFPSRQSQSQKQKENGEKVGSIFRPVHRIFFGVFDTFMDIGWSIVKSGLMDDDRSPIHSGNEGLEFHPKIITKMTFSLDQLKQIKAKLNVTINDVIVGIIFLGTRMYMKLAAARNDDELGNNTEATALVLLNTRVIGGYKSVSEMLKPDAEMPWGNRFAFLHLPMTKLTDAEYSNPLDFVLKAHEMIKRKRNSAAVYFTGKLLETMRKFRGSEATSRYIKGTVEKSSVTITNLIGPVEKVSMANNPVSDFYFVIGGCPQSLVVTIMSYMGKLNVVFATEKGLIDSEKYKSCIENAFQMTLKATAHPVSDANS